MRRFRRALRIEHRAEHVGDMRQRDKLVLLGQVRFEPVEIDLPIFSQRADIDFRPGALGQHLPWDNVRMMLEHGQHDPVARREVRPAPAFRHEVDPLGRTTHEDDFVLGLCADKLGRPPPRRFIGARHLGRTCIDPAMDRRIVAAQRTAHRIDHHLRLLRGRGGVEIVPRLAVSGQQAGEIGFTVENDGFAHTASPSASSAASSRRSCSPSSSSATSAPPMKARTSRRFAASGGRPRAAM